MMCVYILLMLYFDFGFHFLEINVFVNRLGNLQLIGI